MLWPPSHKAKAPLRDRLKRVGWACSLAMEATGERPWSISGYTHPKSWPQNARVAVLLPFAQKYIYYERMSCASEMGLIHRPTSTQ